MKFGTEEDDLDNRPYDRYHKKSTTPLSKLTATSGSRIGCWVLGAIVFYLISHWGGLVISTLLFLLTLYIVIEKTTVFKEKNRNDHKDNTEKTVAKLQQENEKYRHERDRTLEKLSPMKILKTDNENLKSQIERQAHKTNELLVEITKLKTGLKMLEREKLGYADDLSIEKDRSRREFESLQRKMEEELNKYKNKIDQLNEENFQQTLKISAYTNSLNSAQDQKKTMEMNIAQLTENLKQAQNNRLCIVNEAKAAILKEQEAVKQYKQTLQNAQKGYTEMEANLKRSEDKLKKFQDSQLLLETLKAENKRLKEQESEGLTCNICEDRPRNAYLDPCGHTLCMVCATEVQGRNNKCPVCRKRIHKLGHMYFS